VSECSTTTEVLFGASFAKPLMTHFDVPRSSSDAGALLLRLLDDRRGIATALAGALPDARDPSPSVPDWVLPVVRPSFRLRADGTCVRE
jgi:hypothetical protein